MAFTKEDLARIKDDIPVIKESVAYFVEQRGIFEIQTENLHNLLSKHPAIRSHIHSTKYRVKDAGHLEGKLIRKALQAKKDGREFDVTKKNLFERITDLGGVRLLHLHTMEMATIHPAILRILKEQDARLVEGAVANTWDDEYQRLFASWGIRTVARDSLYTSVHYVIELHESPPRRYEIQVRTLAEELWGEVSHKLDYPESSTSTACQEQIKVLARVTSGCTRLVDSIFSSSAEHGRLLGAIKLNPSALATIKFVKVLRTPVGDITRGQTLNLEYQIESGCEMAEGIWLGAHFRDKDKKLIANQKEDTAIVLRIGKHNYSRPLTFPKDKPAGVYTLNAGLWFGTAGFAGKSIPISGRHDLGQAKVK